MRVELQNDKFVLCGVILPTSKIKAGQTWASSSGTVQITGVDQFGWVQYCWIENGELRSHEKDAFSFQCRYCLVLLTADIPEELT